MPLIPGRKPLPKYSPERLPLSLLERHRERWKDCTACSLCRSRKHVVLCRGKIPCDLLLCGEGPGFSEDVVGVPFCGPAGHLLDSIVNRAVPEGVRVAFTNLVCCIPLTESGEKNSEPDVLCIESCSVRLEEFVEIAAPRLVVAVGTLARDWLEVGQRYSIKIDREIPRGWIKHPSAILRMNIAQQGLEIQRATVALRNACEEHLE